jgi:hypothetical protein
MLYRRARRSLQPNRFILGSSPTLTTMILMLEHWARCPAEHKRNTSWRYGAGYCKELAKTNKFKYKLERLNPLRSQKAFKPLYICSSSNDQGSIIKISLSGNTKKPPPHSFLYCILWQVERISAFYTITRHSDNRTLLLHIC